MMKVIHIWIFVYFLIVACVLVVVVEAKCSPTKILMTRATGSESRQTEGETWNPRELQGNVNMANLWGSLKYIVSEVIDYKSGVTNTSGFCMRKNNISIIQFYQVTICNTEKAMRYFNPVVDEGVINVPEYGPFLAYDDGKCDGALCSLVYGAKGTPTLGPWVGIQSQDSDYRNPTDKAFWYSIPGECSEMRWGSKTEDCRKVQSSMKCAGSKLPDGQNCIWNFQYLGEIFLDSLVGITEKINPRTRQTYKNYNEFCLDGGVEFERDQSLNFVKGLTFWKKPLDRAANYKRILKLIAHYRDVKKYPQNLPLPTYIEYLEVGPPSSSNNNKPSPQQAVPNVIQVPNKGKGNSTTNVQSNTSKTTKQNNTPNNENLNESNTPHQQQPTIQQRNNHTFPKFKMNDSSVISHQKHKSPDDSLNNPNYALATHALQASRTLVLIFTIMWLQ